MATYDYSLELGLPPMQRSMLRYHQRCGTRRFVLSLTLIAIAISMAITTAITLVLRLSEAGSLNIWVGLAISATVPSFAAPLVSLGAARLLGSLTESYGRVNRLSVTDPLTGVLNRRGLLGEAERIFAEESGDGEIAVGMVDLDSFKLLNDTYGHDVGDSMLTTTAHLLTEEIGARGVVGRIGGDEFAFIFFAPSSDVTNLCKQITASCHSVRLSSGVVSSASVGISMCQPGDSMGTALARADDVLYSTKPTARTRKSQRTQRQGRPIAGAVR